MLDRGPGFTEWRGGDLPWWVATEEELAGLPVGAPEAIRPLPASSRWQWAVGTSAATVVLHGRDRTDSLVLHGWTASIESLAVDAEGRRLAAVDRQGEIIVFDLENPSDRQRVTQPRGGLNRWSLAFSPSGAALASVARGRLGVVYLAASHLEEPGFDAADAVWLDEETLALIDLKGVLATLVLPSGFPPSRVEEGVSALSRAGDALVVAHPDGRITSRPATAPDEVGAQLTTRLERIVQVDRHDDGRALVRTSDGRGWLARPDAQRAERLPVRVRLLDAAWSIDGRSIGLALADGSAALHRPTILTANLPGHTHGVRSVAAQPGGRVAIGGVAERELMLATIGRDERPQAVGRPGDTTYQVAVRGDSLFARVRNGPAWVFRRGSRYATAPAGGSGMSVSRSGRWLALFGGQDHTVDIHRLDRSGESRTIFGSLAAFAPDSPQLAVVNGTEASSLAIFREGGEVPVTEHTLEGEPTALIWGPTGPGLTYATRRQIIALGDPTLTWSVPEGAPVRRMAWNAAGSRLATVAGGRAQVWDRGPHPMTVPCSEQVYDVDWSDDTTLVLATGGGLVQVFTIEPDKPDPVRVGTVVCWGPAADRADWTIMDLPSAEVEAADDARRDGGIVDDRPTKDVDHLGARFIAVGLDDLLRRELTTGDGRLDRTVAVDLDAEWGRGKSTVLAHLEDLDDDERDGRPPWLVVHHDAWRHSRTSPHWWAMARDLREALAAERTPKGRGRLSRAEWRCRLAAAVGWQQAVLTLLVVTAIAGVLLLTDIVKTSDGFTSVSALLTFIGVLIAGATLVGGLGRSARRFMAWSHSAGPDALSSAELTPLAQAAEHIRWLRRQALRDADGRGWQNRRPLLFAIDELDRCDAATVVEVLDSVHTLMRPDTHAIGRSDEQLAPVAFLVLADAAWVRHAYQTVHQDQADALRHGVTLGAQFHAKLFNLVVPLPRVTPTQHLRYAAETLAQLTGSTRLDAVRLIAPDVQIEPSGEPTVEADAEEPALDELDDAEPSRPNTSVIVPTQVEVPEPAPARTLRQRLIDLHVIPSTDALTETTRDKVAQRQRHVLEGYSGLLPRNPRALKRVVNDWTVQVIVRGGLDDAEQLTDDEMIRWVILAQSWPDLADRLLEMPDLDTPDTIDLAAVERHLGDQDDLFAQLCSQAVARVWPMVGEASLGPTWVRAVAKLAGRWPPVGGAP